MSHTSIIALALAAGACAPCAGAVWFVRAGAPPGGNGLSFATAFTSLDTALAAAGPGDEIRVATGTYVPSLPGGRESTFTLKAGVALYGGFAGDNDAFGSRSPASFPTVLSGDRLGDDQPGWSMRVDNCRRVVTAADAAIVASTVLDGFTITGGHADGAGVLSGAGLYIFDCAPTVRACTFVENHAASASETGHGGAAMIDCPGPAVRSVDFRSCAFLNNLGTEGGAVCAIGSGASVTLAKCRFLANVAGRGGAIYLTDAVVTAVSCTLNLNGAVSDDGGAVLSNSGRAVLINCEIAGNTAARFGGALEARCCNEADLLSCTVASNYAGSRAGGVHVGPSAAVTVSNSVLFNNSDATGAGQEAQVCLADGFSLAAINRTLVTGWTGSLGGTGNLGGDPHFTDPVGADEALGSEDDDYRLLPGSPCIDTGDDALLPADTADLDDDGITAEWLPLDLLASRRVIDGNADSTERTDMGAYEYRCPADHDQNGFVNGVDFDAFAADFELGLPSADFNADGFVTGVDFDDFALRFEQGC